MPKFIGLHHSAYAEPVFPWRLKPLIKTQGVPRCCTITTAHPEGQNRAGFRHAIDAGCFPAVGINLYLAFSKDVEMRGKQMAKIPSWLEGSIKPTWSRLAADGKRALGRQRQTADNKDDRVIMRNSYYLLRHSLHASPGVKCFCVLIGLHSPYHPFSAQRPEWPF